MTRQEFESNLVARLERLHFAPLRLRTLGLTALAAGAAPANARLMDGVTARQMVLDRLSAQSDGLCARIAAGLA